MKVKKFLIILSVVVVLTIGLFVYLYIQKRSLFDQLPVFATSRSISELEFMYSFGNDGAKEDNLKQPIDLVVDRLGKAYVLDHAAKQIKVYDPNGAFLFSFGKGKEQADDLTAPSGIALYQDMILVTEPVSGRIQAFSKDGEFVKTFFSSPEGEKYSPVGLIEAEGNHVLFTDVAGHRIVEVDENGQVISSFGGPGNKDGQLAYPNDITIDEDKQFYVSDSNNGRIVVFDSTGRYVRAIDGTANGAEKMALPRGLTIDPYNRLIVIDPLSNQIRFFELAGNSIFTYGELGVEDGQLSFPNGVAVDGKKIFIADRENHRVQVFAVKK